ncbi:MAG: hypothetical protein CVV42_11840 [Candidatus Riflebacteria bacterium HGW-Riflebacteria-2]|jgi:iron complex transport system substrate-binding protein|nr:MAG: hypothetical protein CVV42_11840 [Candidatus Riflebacteria bacterium HGW-Riflebacteria-2]
MKHFAVLFSAILALTLFLTATANAANDIRIISLVPSQTELLFHLGLGGHVVGTSDYCNYPEEARRTTKIGALELNIERIMSLRPTLLVDVNNMHKKYALLFSQLGLNYVNFTVTRLEQLPVMAEELSRLVGKPEKGIEFSANWQAQTAELTTTTASAMPKVYFEIWDTPMQAAGQNSYIGDMIKTAGGDNILSDMAEFPVVNSETVLSADPEIIIIAYPLTDKDNVSKRPGWQRLRAVKNKQIHAMDQDLFIRPGPRNLVALQQLRDIFRKVKTNDKTKLDQGR